MAKDGTTIILGIIYCALAGLNWLFIFLPSCDGWHCGPYIFISFGSSTFTFFGILFLIPSFIMYMIFFCSTEGSTSASVGFGLGIPGWVLVMIGSIFNFLFEYISFVAIMLLSFAIALTIFGSILFTRRHDWEQPLDASSVSPTGPSTTLPTYSPSPTRPGPPCSKCNRATRFIAEYNRYYCDQCQQYV